MTFVSAPGTPSIHRSMTSSILFSSEQSTHVQNAHLDEAMATVVDRYDSETIRTVIYRVLVEEYPFRTATADLDVDNVDGVRIGTAATRFLAELPAQSDD